jgi:hypothetical protein
MFPIWSPTALMANGEEPRRTRTATARSTGSECEKRDRWLDYTESPARAGFFGARFAAAAAAGSTSST